MTAPAREMTVREAAEAIGWGSDDSAARRLLRRIDAAERDSGRALFPRRARGRQSTRIITMGLLRQHLPWLFDYREEMRDSIRKELADVYAKLDDCERRDKVLAAHIAQLSAELSRVQSRLQAVNGDA